MVTFLSSSIKDKTFNMRNQSIFQIARNNKNVFEVCETLIVIAGKLLVCRSDLMVLDGSTYFGYLYF